MKLKKLLASLLTVAMLTALFPVVVLADASLTSITIREGVNAATLGTPHATDAAQAVRGTVELTAAQAAVDDFTIVAAPTAGLTVNFYRFAPTLPSPATGIPGTSANAITNQTLNDGDIIVAHAYHAGSGEELLYVIDVTVTTALPPGGGSTGTIAGVASVENPVFNVHVPSNLNFAIDPLQLGDVVTGSQFSENDFRIANMSNLPVLVSFDITATAAANVNLVASATDLTDARTGTIPRNAHLGVLAANAVAPGPATQPTFGAPTAGEVLFNPAIAGTLNYFGATNTTTRTSTVAAEFLLGAATPADAPATLAIDNAGVASFTFFGAVNTYAPWVANDITVSGAWSLFGIKASDYTALAATTNGLNVLPVGGTAPDITVATATTGAQSIPATPNWTGESLTILFEARPAANTIRVASSVANLGTANAWVSPTDWTYNADTGLLTITRTFGSPGPATQLVVQAGTGTSQVTLTIPVTAAP